MGIDGIVCYVSDLAAYVAEKLGLPTSPYESIEILVNKDKFRKFLKENKFNTPLAMGFTSIDDVKKNISKFKLPVIIKLVDSSGNKGVSKLDKLEKCDE